MTIEAQKQTCERYGAAFLAAPANFKVGISRNVRDGVLPLNGLRHPPSGESSGWYIWAGESMGSEDDFFVPLHIEHLKDWCPQVIRFLGLAPGWRFLIADDYEDVWEDPSLLDLRP